MLVLRRSHAKSRNGCDTCKSRRVKCDEHRPYCLNCRRLSRPCNYSQPSTISQRLSGWTYVWPEAVEQACQEWKDRGKSPYRLLSHSRFSGWSHLPIRSLRYLHYLCSLAQMLDKSMVSQFCIWWEEFPRFLQVAAQNDFVVYALIFISAKRLAKVTKLSGVLEDVAHYQALAIQGLGTELGRFSRRNADAVLCASLLLLFQQDTWTGWKALLEGTCSVIEQMRPWLKDSIFALPLQGSVPSASSLTYSQHTPSGDTISIATFSEALESLFDQAITSLNRLSTCVKHNTEAATTLRGLRDLVRIIKDHPTEFKVQDQYRLAYPYSSFMNPLSSSFPAIKRKDPLLIATLAHLFAVNIALSMVFPVIDVAPFIPTQLRSLCAIVVWFETFPRTHCKECARSHDNTELMIFPRNTIGIYQQWKKWS